MKRILFFAAFLVLAVVSGQAQNFGAKAGFGSLSASEGGDGVTGFTIGVTADFEMTEQISLQPEALYSSFDGASLISVPVMAKYYVANGFNIQAGPQVNLDFGEAPEDYSSFAVALAAGGGYDINEQFFVDARYAFEVTNRYTGDAEDVSWKYNLFMVGVGYKF